MLRLISCVAGVSRFGRDVLPSLSLAKLGTGKRMPPALSFGRGHRVAAGAPERWGEVRVPSAPPTAHTSSARPPESAGGIRMRASPAPGGGTESATLTR
jgi:hypothetical protein